MSRAANGNYRAVIDTPLLFEFLVVIDGRWEISNGGIEFPLDFDVTYTRVGERIDSERVNNSNGKYC